MGKLRNKLSCSDDESSNSTFTDISCNEKEIAHFRIFHNIEGEKVFNVYLSGKAIALNLKYQQYTAYLTVPAGKQTLSIVRQSDEKVLLTKVIDLKSNETYTEVIAGFDTDPDSVIAPIFRDRTACPKQGFSLFRFINAAAGSPNVDVYIDGIKLFSDVAYGYEGKTDTGSNYANFRVNNFTSCLTVKFTGINDNLLGPIDIHTYAGRIVTLVLTGSWLTFFSVIDTNDNPGECIVYQKNFNLESVIGKWYVVSGNNPLENFDGSREYQEFTVLYNEVIIKGSITDKNWNVLTTYTFQGVPNPANPALLTLDAATFTGLEAGKNKFLTEHQGYPTLTYPWDNSFAIVKMQGNFCLIGSTSLDYWFLLSRTPQVCVEDLKEWLAYTESIGFNTSFTFPYRYDVITTKGCKKNLDNEQSVEKSSKKHQKNRKRDHHEKDCCEKDLQKDRQKNRERIIKKIANLIEHYKVTS